MARMKAAQVHRDRDLVSLYILPAERGGGRTVFLSPDEARQIGQALINAAGSRNFATKRWDNDV